MLHCCAAKKWNSKYKNVWELRLNWSKIIMQLWTEKNWNWSVSEIIVQMRSEIEERTVLA